MAGLPFLCGKGLLLHYGRAARTEGLCCLRPRGGRTAGAGGKKETRSRLQAPGQRMEDRMKKKGYLLQVLR